MGKRHTLHCRPNYILFTTTIRTTIRLPSEPKRPPTCSMSGDSDYFRRCDESSRPFQAMSNAVQIQHHRFHDTQLCRATFNARSMQGTDRTGPPAPGVKRNDGVPLYRTSSRQSRLLIIPAPFGQGIQAFSKVKPVPSVLHMRCSTLLIEDLRLWSFPPRARLPQQSAVQARSIRKIIGHGSREQRS